MQAFKYHACWLRKGRSTIKNSSFDTKYVLNTVSIADAPGISFPLLPESLLAIPGCSVQRLCEGKLFETKKSICFGFSERRNKNIVDLWTLRPG